jgi:hypothetical protein
LITEMTLHGPAVSTTGCYSPLMTAVYFSHIYLVNNSQ